MWVKHRTSLAVMHLTNAAADQLGCYASHKCRCRPACILAAPQSYRQTHTRSSTFAPTRWHTQQHGMWYPFIRCHGLFVKPDQTHPFIARGPQSIRSRTNLTKHNRRCSRKTCDRHAHTLRHKFSSDHTTPMHVSCPLQRIACLLRERRCCGGLGHIGGREKGGFYDRWMVL